MLFRHNLLTINNAAGAAMKKVKLRAKTDGNQKELVKQIILGVCPSKSNSYRIGHKGLFKSSALANYEKSFYLQCDKYRNKNIDGLFEFHMSVYITGAKAHSSALPWVG